MISCPVCEHQQVPQPTCELCGRPLGPAPLDAGVVLPLDELEPTRAEGTGPIAPVTPLEELEATRLAPVSVDVGPVDPSVERASAPLVGAVVVVPLEDQSDHRAPAVGERTVLVDGPVTCRFCQHVQSTGLVCEGCGLRLPRRPGAPSAGAARPARAQDVGGERPLIRCHACGAPTRAGGRCGDCGVQQRDGG